MPRLAARDRLSFIESLMPTLVEKPPEGGTWLHEVKCDGCRTQIIIDHAGVSGGRIQFSEPLPGAAKAIFHLRVQEHAEPAPKGMKRPATQWVHPGLIGRVKHLRGEEDLRHASLQDFREE